MLSTDLLEPDQVQHQTGAVDIASEVQLGPAWTTGHQVVHAAVAGADRDQATSSTTNGSNGEVVSSTRSVDNWHAEKWSIVNTSQQENCMQCRFEAGLNVSVRKVPGSYEVRHPKLCREVIVKRHIRQ